MKKILLFITITLLFVSCGKNFKSYYNEKKLEKYFERDDVEFKKGSLEIKNQYGTYIIKLFDNNDEIEDFRKKLDEKMKLRGMTNAMPSKNQALYTNYKDYTVAFSTMPPDTLPKNKKGVLIAETELSFEDTRSFEEFKTMIIYIRERLKFSVS